MQEPRFSKSQGGSEHSPDSTQRKDVEKADREAKHPTDLCALAGVGGSWGYTGPCWEKAEVAVEQEPKTASAPVLLGNSCRCLILCGSCQGLSLQHLPPALTSLHAVHLVWLPGVPFGSGVLR